MTHPNYMLNPGDMFAVEQKKVLWATGAPKPGVVKAGAAGGEEAAEGEGAVEEQAANKEALDPVTPDEAAAEAKKAEGKEGETIEGEEFAGKKGPEKKPWLGHQDPNNQFDASKPYATPWRPRDYLPPFAFIPRYLEVCFIHSTYFLRRLQHAYFGCAGQPQYLSRRIPSPSRCPTWVD